MDNAVALVQAYLRVNGYFTVSEYPVLEARGREHRTVTDLDMLAFRFPGAGRIAPRSAGRSTNGLVTWLDAALGTDSSRGDMIVGEVKEGRAVLNEAANDPAVLRTALVRFGRCPPEGASSMVETPLENGRATLPLGHEIRVVVFGGIAVPGRHLVITLGHVVRFLQEYITEHWEVVRQAEQKDPVFSFLTLLEKTLRGGDAR